GAAAVVAACGGRALLHPPPGRPGPAEAASPLAALRSGRSGGVVPAPSFGTSFVAAVAVDADAGHPAIDEVRAALEVAAPFLARGAELHALRRHARETEAQRVRSARALDALPDAVLVLDPDALVLMTNRRAADLLVVSAGDDEARGAAVQRNNLFFSAFRARTLLARAGHRASRELVLMDPREGRDRIFEVVMLPLPSADGRSEDSLF